MTRGSRLAMRKIYAKIICTSFDCFLLSSVVQAVQSAIFVLLELEYVRFVRPGDP